VKEKDETREESELENHNEGLSIFFLFKTPINTLEVVTFFKLVVALDIIKEREKRFKKLLKSR